MEILNIVKDLVNNNPKMYIILTGILCLVSLILIYLLGTKAGKFIYYVSHWIN